MRSRTGQILTVVLVLGLVACGSDAGPGSTMSTTTVPTVPPTTTPVDPTTTPVETTVAPPPSTTVAPEPAAPYPVARFAAISEDPMPEDIAVRFEAALDEMLNLPLAREIVAGGGGMTATVMTAEGTWSGAVGNADGVRALVVEDQFGIGSVTKSVTAAQVMQLVEAGDLALDDPADQYLPAELGFDAKGATIRQLLSHRSGFRDPDGDWDLENDRQHVWTSSEVIKLTREPTSSAGSVFEYSNANYFLLGLIIEQVRGRPLAEVLRGGVLAFDGVERLVYQPDEQPSEPMAMPGGESTDALILGGGYLSSIAAATQGGPAAGMASDSPSLARWWRALCAGEIISPDSLAEMATVVSPESGLGYGLGVFNVAGGYGPSVGHAGTDYGFVSWAGCLPDQGAVVVVLANREVDYTLGMGRNLVGVLRSD